MTTFLTGVVVITGLLALAALIYLCVKSVTPAQAVKAVENTVKADVKSEATKIVADVAKKV